MAEKKYDEIRTLTTEEIANLVGDFGYLRVNDMPDNTCFIAKLGTAYTKQKETDEIDEETKEPIIKTTCFIPVTYKSKDLANGEATFTIMVSQRCHDRLLYGVVTKDDQGNEIEDVPKWTQFKDKTYVGHYAYITKKSVSHKGIVKKLQYINPFEGTINDGFDKKSMFALKEDPLVAAASAPGQTKIVIPEVPVAQKITSPFAWGPGEKEKMLAIQQKVLVDGELTATRADMEKEMKARGFVDMRIKTILDHVWKE